MMLSLNSFKPIELDAKELFDKHYSKYPLNHSDNVFTTMISWMDYARTPKKTLDLIKHSENDCYLYMYEDGYNQFKYLFYNDSLCIKTTVDDIIQFRIPIGKKSKELFDSLLQITQKENLEYPFGLIEIDEKKWIEENYPGSNFIPTPEYFDYVYLSSDLAYLLGSKYAKIRNRLNKFEKNYDFEIEKVSEINSSEIKQFLKRWCIWRDCEKDPLLKFERRAINYSIDNFIDLGLSGITVIVDGRIEAISIYEAMNSDTIVVHFEKGSADFDGIYKLVNNETAKLVEKYFSFINRESDMGNPGLKKAKISYRPHHMVEVFKMKML